MGNCRAYKLSFLIIFCGRSNHFCAPPDETHIEKLVFCYQLWPRRIMSNLIPILDFSALSIEVDSPPDSAFRTVGLRAFEAFSRSGFVYLKNHGIPVQVVGDAFSSSKRFFESANEEKRKCTIGSDYLQGWVSMGVEKLNVKDRVRRLLFLKRKTRCRNSWCISENLILIGFL